MSAIPRTKEALAELLGSLDDASLTRGVPPQLPGGGQNVYVLGAENIETRRPAVGIKQREFDLRLLLECHAPLEESSRAAVEGQLWALVDLIDELLDENSAFGPDVLDAELRPEREQTGAVRDGWLSRMTAFVHVLAEES